MCHIHMGVHRHVELFTIIFTLISTLLVFIKKPLHFLQRLHSFILVNTKSLCVIHTTHCTVCHIFHDKYHGANMNTFFFNSKFIIIQSKFSQG